MLRHHEIGKKQVCHKLGPIKLANLIKPFVSFCTKFGVNRQDLSQTNIE
jgi:hypothetical protein